MMAEMQTNICYLGDGRLSGAASYLAGVMLHHGLAFDHVPSDTAPPPTFMTEPYRLYVVSDYPAQQFGQAAMAHVAERVEAGAGLVMLGGWESYFGRLGEYHDSPLAAVLPVTMSHGDDRRNWAQPCLIQQKMAHPIVDGLPWDRPPGIGGFNEIQPKPTAQTVLTAVTFDVHQNNGEFQFARNNEWPLLVVGQHGVGRTAALATDVAPHWVGGLVDWGDRRITQKVVDNEIEVGNWYARFFRNLLAWTGRLDETCREGVC
jgi:hypothetical protein